MSRLRRFSAFALVGASGVPVNAATMRLLHAAGIDYLLAAVVSTQVAVAWNLALTELVVFRDRRESLRFANRAVRYFVINNVDTLVRIPLLALLVETLGMRPAPANLLLVVVAAGAKYVLVSRVVYRPVTLPALPTPVPGAPTPPRLEGV